MSSTQDCLLDAAETLFIEHGFAATSLRSIASRADANIAAAHYHFGSKQGLLEALVRRRLTPINQARLAALDALQAQDQPPELCEVLEAFLRPVIESAEIKNLPALIGRIHCEPPSVTKPILEKEFGTVAMRFQAALSELLPGITQEELRWRFHFLVGAMLQTLVMPEPLCTEESLPLEAKIEELIHFSIAGFTAPPRKTGDRV